MTISPTRFRGGLVMLERDRRTQLIFVATSSASTVCRRRCRDRNTSSPPSGRRRRHCRGVRCFVELVEDLSSSTSTPFSITAVFCRPRHLRLSLPKTCRAQGCFVIAPGALIRHIETAGSWPSKSRPGSIRPRPCFSPPHASKRPGPFVGQPSTRRRSTPSGAAFSFKADDPVDAALQGAFLAAFP